jgi:hypothetical protein
MEHPTNVASIQSGENASNISPTVPTLRTARMSGTMVRKVARRTFPRLGAAEVNLVMPPSPKPLSHPPPSQDEDLPVAKRPRLWTSTADWMSTVAVADSDSDSSYSVQQSVTDLDEDYSDAKSIADAAKPDDSVIVAPTHALMTLASLPKDEMDPVAVVPPVQNNYKGKWTPEEDTLLAKAVQKHGKRWVPIAAMVPGRTNPQCRSRWLRHLDPTNGKKGRWTPQEDATLIEAVGKLGKEFTLVAALIPGRTNERCRDRWFRWFDIASIQGLEKGTWTPEEDAKLTEAVQKLGIHWVPVAALVCTRTNTQCRQRWLDNLDPDRVRPARSPRSPRKKSTTPGKSSNDRLTLFQLKNDMYVETGAIM